MVDKTLALRLGRDRRYPSREALIRFGKEVCHVPNPQQAIERIAQAMRDAWRENCGLFPAEFAANMNAQWEEGLFDIAVERQVFPAPRQNF
jgi:serine/threonine-protein kinase HipA